jgi:hypothetical protein
VLSDVSLLFIPNVFDAFVLQTDASSKGVGAVLSVIRNGEELPVGYYSKKLEQKYVVTELECLAVVRAIDHFAVHLTGRVFTVVTDHRALQYLESSRQPQWPLNPMGSATPTLFFYNPISPRKFTSECRWTVKAGMGED